MTTPAQVFDDHVAVLKRERDAPWGRLLYGLTQANLQRHLDRVPLRILDAGGGIGVDAIRLAQQGHSVTLVDYSQAMLDEARCAAESAGVAGRIDLRLGDLDSLPVLFPQPAFDVVLCHNVLQYVHDPKSALTALCGVLTTGGLISIIGVNRDSEPMRLAVQRLDQDAAYAGLDETHFQSALYGTDMHLHTAAEMVRLLEEVGCSVVGEYGIRSVCDYISNNEVKFDPAFFASLERLELALTDRLPYRLLARFCHVIARKTREQG